jgi:NADH:ubiquinone oxidoreductase subunit F (NADH-binding)
MYNAWNQMRTAINKPRSTYPGFRKLIWNLKKQEVIQSIPEAEIRARGLLGEAPIARSYYRLHPDYVKHG